MTLKRLDLVLVERRLVESRSQAQRLIMAGQVLVNDQVIYKPATRLSEESNVIIAQGSQYVSRGGEKLAAALDSFNISIAGLICVDVGASTGGFTDCLLQHGAARVYAIDVGKGIVHWKLRKDPRVVLLEETNARYLDRLQDSVDLVTIDASFISLKMLLPVVKGWFAVDTHPEETGNLLNQVIALIKPQFEAGRKEADRGRGVIRDPAIHKRVVFDLLLAAQKDGYRVMDLIQSPLVGPKGNREFFTWLLFPEPNNQNNVHHIETLVKKLDLNRKIST